MAFKLMYNLYLNNKFLKNPKIDFLTKTATLDDTLQRARKMIKEDSNTITLIININNFKLINETYGYLAGNKLLIQVANSLKQEMKNIKSIKSVIGRLDGDEFVIFVQNYKGKAKLSNRLYKLFENKRFIVDSQLDRINLSFSIGESHSTFKSPISIEKLLRNADIDMHYNRYRHLSIIRSPLKLHHLLFSKEIYQIINALSEKDMYTYIHSQYTAQYSVALAQKLFLPDSIIKRIYLGGILHDIGKILISNDILRKPDKLTDDEFQTIKKHVDYGSNIIRTFDLIDTTKNMILYHHERWDGKGYPNGILGRNTPIEGRIIQIADAFSAMTIRRVYRDRMSLDDALEEVLKNGGTQFDPKFSKIFVNLFRNKKFQSDF